MSNQPNPSRRRAGRPALDPWADWTNGKVWTLRVETDLSVTARAKQQQLSKYASRHKLRVETWTSDDPDLGLMLHFQFLAPTAQAEPVALTEDDDYFFDDPRADQ